MEMSESKLSMKEQAFCKAYAGSYNRIKAAAFAGYGRRRDGSTNLKSAKQAAWRLLKRPEVKACVEALLVDSANQAGATKYYIVLRLKEVADRCLQQVSPEGAEDCRFAFKPHDAISALKVLADIQHFNKNVDNYRCCISVQFIEK